MPGVCPGRDARCWDWLAHYHLLVYSNNYLYFSYLLKTVFTEPASDLAIHSVCLPYSSGFPPQLRFVVVCRYIPYSYLTEDCHRVMGGGGGVLDLSLCREVPPWPWNSDPFYDKKLVKIMENWYPVYMIFRSNYTHFLVKMHDFKTLFIMNLQNSLNYRSCLSAGGRKTIPWRVTRPRIACVWEYPPLPSQA